MKAYGSITITDLTEQYTHIRYSSNPDGTNFSATVNKYIGIYTGNSENAPTDKSKYTWSQLEGNDGTSITIIRTNTLYGISAYANGDNNTSPDDISWSSNIPITTIEKPYLWTKVIVDYSDGNSTVAYSVSSTMDSIQIGGRNLIRMNECTDGYVNASNGAFVSSNSWLCTDYIKVYCGDKYIYQVFSDFDLLEYKYGYAFYDTDGNLLKYGDLFTSNAKNDYKEIAVPEFAGGQIVTYDNLEIVTATGEKIVKSYPFIYIRCFFTKNDYLKYQLEKGNRPTDWSAAPEDIEALISSTETNIKSYVDEENKKIVDSIAEKTTYKDGNGVTHQINENYNTIITTVNGTSQTVTSIQNDLNGNGEIVGIKSRLTTVETTAGEIKSKVEDSEHGLSKVEQTANKINWLVSSGTSSSNMKLTSDALNVISNGINLTGKVTFDSFDVSNKALINSSIKEQQRIYILSSSESARPTAPTSWINVATQQTGVDNFTPTWSMSRPISNDTYPVVFSCMQFMHIDDSIECTEPKIDQATIIDGRYIDTGSITASQINVANFFADNAIIEGLQTTELNADMITSGLIHANNLDLHGLTVTDNNNITTLQISDEGNVQIRGSLESLNYADGLSGWTINSNGDAQFNNVEIMGTLKNIDGGITRFNYGGNVGNKNLALGTETGITVTSTKESNDVIKIYELSCNWADLIGKSVTISFDYNATGGTSISKCEIGMKDSPYHRWSKPDVTTNNNGHYSATYTLLEGETYVENGIIAARFDNFVSGTIYIYNFKVEIGEKETPWTPAPEEVTEIRFWAGAEFDRTKNDFGIGDAPLRIYNDGRIVATNGEFSGLFSGDIKIGNIEISDNNNIGGDDALLKIKRGDTNIDVVSLTDGFESIFRQNIIFKDSFDRQSILLNRDGFVGANQFKVSKYDSDGNETNNINLSSDGLQLNGKLIGETTNGDAIDIMSNIEVGSGSQSYDMTVHGDATVENSLTIGKKIYFGDRIVCTITANGIDFDFME